MSYELFGLFVTELPHRFLKKVPGNNIFKPNLNSSDVHFKTKKTFVQVTSSKGFKFSDIY